MRQLCCQGTFCRIVANRLQNFFTRVEDDVDHQLSPDQLVDGGLPVEEELQESPEAFAGKNIRAVGECHFARPMKLPRWC